MKKIALLPVAAIMGLALVSCGDKAANVTLSNPADSLAYAQGIRISEGFRYNAVNRLGIDSTLVPVMLDGVKDAFFITKEENPKQRAYNIGIQYGIALREQVLGNIYARMEADGDSAGIDEQLFFNAFAAAVNEQELAIDLTTASIFVRQTDYKRHLAYMEEKYQDNKISSQDFLEVNAQQPGVQVTPSGLQYRVEKQGKGPKPTESDRVKVNYKGTLIDGTEFDSSYKRNEPSVFSVKGVIKGFAEGLQMMPVGSKYTFFIPDSLAYGDRDMPNIKPFSALIFEVELLGIEK